MVALVHWLKPRIPRLPQITESTIVKLPYSPAEMVSRLNFQTESLTATYALEAETSRTQWGNSTNIYASGAEIEPWF
jgi:hypothetical protein